MHVVSNVLVPNLNPDATHPLVADIKMLWPTNNNNTASSPNGMATASATSTSGRSSPLSPNN